MKIGCALFDCAALATSGCRAPTENAARVATPTRTALQAEHEALPASAVSPPSAARFRPDGGDRGGGTRTPEHARDAHYPSERAVVATKWFAEHGAALARREDGRCWDAGDRVGVPPAPGLVCERVTPAPRKVLFRVLRLEGKAMRLVWEGTVGTWANWLELTPILADDGITLTVHDRAPGACERALCEYREKERHGVRADFGDVLRTACDGRGVHTWSEDRYVQAGRAATDLEVTNPDCPSGP